MSGLRFGLSLSMQGRGGKPPFDFFVDSANGDDGNDGLSAATAKQSLAGVMALGAALEGKRVGLCRNSEFEETLVVDVSGVSFGVYGVGAAPIVNGDDENGIEIHDVSDVTLDGLEVVGNGKATNGGYGIDIAVTAAARQTNITVRNCKVHNFGLNGINVQGRSSDYGFDSILIEGNEVYDCTENYNGGDGSSGIYVWSASGYGLKVNNPTHTDITIKGNYIHDCNGKAGASNWVGSGIVVGQTDGGLVAGNTVDSCGANSNYANGPVGQWCYDAKNVTIRNGVTTNMHVSAGTDGSGFDIDGGCQDCVIEDCVSSDCDGPGLLMYAYADTMYLLPYKRNAMRRNTSTDDGQVSVNQAAAVISTQHLDAESFEDIEFSDNIINVSGTDVVGLQIETTDTALPYLRLATGDIAGNVINASGGAVLASVARTALTYSANEYNADNEVYKFEGVEFDTLAEFNTAMSSTEAHWSNTDKSANLFLQEYQCRAVANASGQWVRGIPAKSGTGKFYAEFIVNGTAGSVYNQSIGVANAGSIGSYPGENANAFVLFYNGSGAVNGSFPSWGVTFTDGDTVDMAYDGTNDRVWYRVNGGNWNGNADYNPATNVGGFNVAAFTNTAAYLVAGFASGDDLECNFGLAPFARTPPSGFSAWNS